MLSKGYSYGDIGQTLGRAASAIWNEVSLNSVKGTYDPQKAHHKAYVRRKYAKYQGMRIVGNPPLRHFMDTKLLEGQSPEAIAGRLRRKLENGQPYVSKDSIYRYIRSPYGRRIEAALRLKRRKAKKRPSKGRLDNRVFIDQRPQYINKRRRIGDTEFDFIVSGKGGQGILLVVVDRRLRVSFLEPIYQVSILAVHTATLQIKKRYPEWLTGTTDNDLLFARHKELGAELGIKIFFCHPYHSWEKGTIENTNGEIRKDVPKGSDLSQYSRQFFKSIEKKLNNRFMKCLKYRTPQEVLTKHRKLKKLRTCRRK